MFSTQLSEPPFLCGLFYSVSCDLDHINGIRNMIYMIACLILSDTSDLSKMSKSNTVILMFIDLTCQPIDCGGWQGNRSDHFSSAVTLKVM